MIKSRKDLKRYLSIEAKRIRVKNSFIQRVSYSELFCTYNYFKNLRHLEYYINKQRKWYDLLPYVWYLWNHRRLKLKYNFYIPPNCVEEGCLLVHPGFVRIPVYARIGKNCTVLPMVLMGKKLPDVEKPDIIIGDNCYISTGVTILGPITIGNNVTIAAGSVVTKDIPDNCLVGGVPAKILKRKTSIVEEKDEAKSIY